MNEPPTLSGRCCCRQRGASGFSLLELIVVMAVLGILVAYALPAYQDATLRAREAVLKEDLQRMRDSLEQYLTDKGVYPEVLDDLVRDGYLRSLPVDPLTGSEDTWGTEIAPWMMTDLGQPAGIWNVFSGADGEGLNGVPYKEW
jgi:general secretion pathway protein G